MWCIRISQSIRSKQPRIWERDNIIRKNSHFFLAHWKYFLSWRGEKNLPKMTIYLKWLLDLRKRKCDFSRSVNAAFSKPSVMCFSRRVCLKTGRWQNKTKPSLLGFFLFGDSLTLLLSFLNFQCTPVQVCSIFVSEYHTVGFRSHFVGICTASWLGTIFF